MFRACSAAIPLIFLVLGCADNTTSAQTPEEPRIDVDLEDVPLPDPDAAADVDAAGDGQEGEDEPAELEDEVVFCETDQDCPAEMCIRLDPQEEERICTVPCITDSDCPEAWTCVPSQLGRDRTAYCFPFDFCWDPDEDGFGVGPGCAGPDCDNDNPDVFPGATEFCNGIDNNCSGVPDDNPVDVGLPCETGFAGRCAEGRTVCMNGVLECEPIIVPEDVEICDGRDNTCDGQVDATPDGEPLTIACSTGPEEKRNVGRCADGVRACVDGAYELQCVGEVLPREERCNGLDDNCDGFVDNDPIDVGGPCDTGLHGRCAQGTWSCIEGERVCVPLHEPAEEEQCDLLDWTCDGQIDVQPDGSPITQACYSGAEETRGEGRCSDGLRTCTGGAWPVECEGEVLPREERCNGMDDNCDGEVDNDPIDIGGSCDTGLLGRCAVGSWACSEEGERVCVPLYQPEEVERCDLEDWTCDGQIDVQPDGSPITQACYSGSEETRGRGRCQDGLRTCAGGVWPVACEGEILPEQERCDSTDWSCSGDPLAPTPPDAPIWFQDADGDGFGNPNVSVRACTQPAGYVDNGLDCNDNDARIRPGAVERCDGLDNNCDGLVNAVRNSANQPVSVCPGGCTGVAYSANSGFMFCKPGGGWSQPAASNVCAGQGMVLAYIDNAAENTWVFSQASRIFGNWGQLWIGGYAAIVGGVRQFFWAPGDPFTYTGWAAGEPNNQGGDENCLELYRTRGWNDNRCSRNRDEFICRTPRP